MKLVGKSRLQAAGWLTPGEACQILKVHPKTLRTWANRGQVRCIKTPGGHRRYSDADVKRVAVARWRASRGMLGQWPPS